MNDSRDDLVHCFVCGGETPPDINLVLYSRKQRNEKLPYFPFLEFHEPAPNAEPMASDSSIQGCVVCYSYLKTQWNHFVRSKTQINKRLYWLKRPAGCEIRQPVNIIELEEILSEQAREEEEKSDSEDEGISTSLPKKEEEEKPTKPSSTVLTPTVERPVDILPKETCCYLCSIPTPKDNMQRISLEKNPITIKQLPEVPVFSVLSKHKPPRGAVLEGPHSTLVCPNCFTDLCRKYPPEEQCQTDQSQASVVNATKCFICSDELTSPGEAKILYAKQVRKGEAYFPFLNHMTPLEEKGTIMPKLYGYTYSCKKCHNVLYQQHMIYEKERMPQIKRKYTEQIQKLRGYVQTKRTPVKSSRADSENTTTDNDKKKMECYICARDLVERFKVYTHPGGADDERPFFPAIANIIPATRTQQLNSHAAGGAAFVCKVCHANLQHQWKQYEQGGQLPNLNRWLRPYNVQEIMCGKCSSTVPTGNTVEYDLAKIAKVDPNAITFGDKVVICTECETNESDEKAETKTPPPQEKSSSSMFQSNPLGSPLLTPELLSAQLAMQQSQYPLMNPYLNLFPSSTLNAYTAQLAAALSQQVQNQASLLTKRSIDSVSNKDGEDTPQSSQPTKKERLSEMDMAAKIQELEAKYESLKNNSMKLAAAVINSDKMPDEAKHIINEIEKN